MGNVLKVDRDLAGSSEEKKSCQDVKLEQVEQQLELLLSKLSEVELWRVQCCLSQKFLPDSPPIPKHCLCSADARKTARTLILCYHEDGALRVLAAAMDLMNQESPTRPKSVPPQLPQTVLQLEPKTSPQFVRMFRRKLIRGIQSPEAVLDALQHHGVLTEANREAVSVYALIKDKNRALVDLVLRKGHEAQQAFFQILSQSDPFMRKELTDEHRKKNFQDSSDFLESLVSGELRCFQWVVAGPPYDCQHFLDDPEDADAPSIRKLLEEDLGSKEAARVTEEVVMKIVPALGAGLSPSIRNFKHNVLAKCPRVFKMKDYMFRLSCGTAGTYSCPYTGLVLEGAGDVIYETVPWDVDFLSSRGLRPAGLLFRFTLLTGVFVKLHLPHCRLLPDKGEHCLSVAHVTGDYVAFVSPGQVTDSHVTISISGFSCFGLVTSSRSSQPIAGLVLLFLQPADVSIFVVLLPRNVCLKQVRKEFRRRTGGKYLETIPDCELIPNQMYKLTGTPVTVIQPQVSKFLNFSDYSNFLPSFEVRASPDVTMVMLKLTRHIVLPPVIGWFFGSADPEVWSRQVRLTASGPSSEPADVSVQLFQVLMELPSDDLKIFQQLLTLGPRPVPVSRLENADTIRTIDLMIQQYHPDGAKEVAEETLRRMNQNQLAEKLERI